MNKPSAAATPSRHIQILPDHVANKIAAGEVVDRPSSVVKELIENGLDAGATDVAVEVTAGGRKAIVVSDNGSGMSRDDALLSVERHATSKIRDTDDIERVGTLGFRGEALAAIAAVSHFTLTTRTRDALGGAEVVMSGGKIQDVRDAGGPVGTTAQVRHLFFNVPARRKFLRSEQTELAHVRQTFLVYALSHPAIGFRLVADGREAWRLPGGASLEDRLRELFGADLVRSLRPVSYASADLKVSGYAGLPAVARSDRSEQYVFINGRPAGAALINYAVSEAYHTLLPGGRHPVVFLYVEMDPSLVDVNVHPAKKEVRFRRPSEVRDVLISSIREALSNVPSAGGARAAGPEAPAAVPEPPQPMLAIEGMPAARTFAYPRLPMAPGETAQPPRPAGGPPVPEAPGSPWTWCRVLGQVGGLYVVLETEDGIVLMDPHAAHERLLYDRYMKQVGERQVAVQGLLAPETVELLPADAERVRGCLPVLKQMGFGVSEFGGDAFIVDALPACLGSSGAEAILSEVAATLERVGEHGGSGRWAEESIAQAACKAAVKARDRLTLAEIEQLVMDLARAEMPYTCPHGRPTVIFTSFDELHRKFGRT